MLGKNGKLILQVSVSLGIALWIFWFLYRDIPLESLWRQVQSSNWAWILGSLFISLFAVWLRAWRWTLVIHHEEGLEVKSDRAYHAVTIGYLVNLLIPRAGEVARCGVLTRTNGVSLGHLFGTVILERSIDLFFLIFSIVLAFWVEKELFLNLVGRLVNLNGLWDKVLTHAPVLVGGLLILLIFLFLLNRKYRDHGFIAKLRRFIREIVSGLKRINHLSSPISFWMVSILIWISYFLTMYMVSIGISSTANLSPGEILLVMVMGSIGMIAPVQGGIGTFHALVAFILIQLGISEEDGKIFAAIIHGTQVLLVLVAGLVSWILMIKVSTWKKPVTH
jgi:glycosyltransferase 2 family protein